MGAHPGKRCLHPNSVEKHSTPVTFASEPSCDRLRGRQPISDRQHEAANSLTRLAAMDAIGMVSVLGRNDFDLLCEPADYGPPMNL
jgi:hypothetical protein